MAQRTVWVTLRNTSEGDLTLELRYLYNRKFGRAMAAASFRELDEAAQARTLASAIAQHVVVGWKRPEPYDAAVVERVLLEVAEEAPEILDGMANRCSDADAMGYPKLVDPVDLGNG